MQVSVVESNFLFYVILLARREICKLWKSGNPPVFADCLKSIIYVSESDMACDKKSQEKVWAPLIKWSEKVT